MSTLLLNAILGSWTAAAVYLARRNPGGGFLLALLGLGLLLTAGASGALVLLFGLHPLFAPLAHLSWALFIHAPLLLLGTTLRARRNRRGRTAAAASVAALLLGTGGWAFLVEPGWLEVTRHRIVTDRVAEPLRLAVVADLQTDDPGAHERDALARVAAERPDLVLLAGDYVHTDEPEERPELRRRLREILREVGLEAPLGVFAVRGDVDGDAWRETFEGLPVTTVEATQSFAVGPLQLTCLGAADSRDPGVALSRTGRFHVVLGHRPDYALGSHRADLLVAGHTHGGQVRLPWIGPLMTLSDVPRAWAAGLTWIAPGQALLVSRGIGLERGDAPRLRFGCRPEVVIVDLLPARGGA